MSARDMEGGTLCQLLCFCRIDARRPKKVYAANVKSRIYVDTSVVGGCEDEEFVEHSIRLMDCFVWHELTCL